MRILLMSVCLAMPAVAVGQITGSGGIFYGLNLPATCSRGDVFSSQSLGIIANCTALNVWTPIEGGVSPPFPISDVTGLQTALDSKGTSNFSGAYADLTGKPTLGTAAATAIGDYATAAQGTKADSALQPAGNGGSLTGLTKAQVGLANVDNTTDASKPVSTATQTALNLKANLASPTFTGTVTLPASTALVTPVIGAATGTSLATTGDHTTSAGKIGYATGAGGTVTQLTNKSTGVTLSKACGAITMNGAALAAAAIVSFTQTNTVAAAGDVVVGNHTATGTFGAYTVNPRAGAGSIIWTIRNNSAGSLSEAIVLSFCVVKGVTS